VGVDEPIGLLLFVLALQVLARGVVVAGGRNT